MLCVFGQGEFLEDFGPLLFHAELLGVFIQLGDAGGANGSKEVIHGDTGGSRGGVGKGRILLESEGVGVLRDEGGWKNSSSDGYFVKDGTEELGNPLNRPSLILCK